ncbi:MAG: DUF1778 domain-containing protein [Deltaproteobacteria bacterium]|nr:DUF1778 domain-containing protein [Deltaproteobacteria bacterium]
MVEQALLFFMESRRELPEEAMIPTRLVLDDESWRTVADLVSQPPAPNDALRALMRDKIR